MSRAVDVHARIWRRNAEDSTRTDADGRLMIGTVATPDFGSGLTLITFQSNDLQNTIEIEIPNNVVRTVAARIEAIADSITRMTNNNEE